MGPSLGGVCGCVCVVLCCLCAVLLRCLSSAAAMPVCSLGRPRPSCFSCSRRVKRSGSLRRVVSITHPPIFFLFVALASAASVHSIASFLLHRLPCLPLSPFPFLADFPLFFHSYPPPALTDLSFSFYPSTCPLCLFSSFSLVTCCSPLFLFFSWPPHLSLHLPAPLCLSARGEHNKRISTTFHT